MKVRGSAGVVVCLALVSAACATGERGGAAEPSSTAAVEASSADTMAGPETETTVATTSAAPGPSDSTAAAAGDGTVVLDRVRVEAPSGALSPGARIAAIEVAPDEVTIDDLPAEVELAGPGVDVEILGGEATGDLTVAFTVDPPATPDAVPVVLHVLDDGSWTVEDAVFVDGEIRVTTQDFSLRVPAFLNPVEWIRGLFGGLSRLLGLRTSPPDCRTPPAWAVVLGSNTTAVHECMSVNADGVPEITIRSNRSYWLEVTVPPPNRWVWVSNLPSFAHDLVGEDRYLLPPGETMTIGVDRPSTTREFTIALDRTNATIALSAASLFLGDAPYIGELFTLGKCGQGIAAGRDSFGGVVRGLFNCAVDAFAGLRDPGRAAQAAEEVFGPDGAVDPAVAPELDRLAGRFQGIGRFLRFVQAAIAALTSVEQFADELFEVIDTESAVSVILHAPPPTTTAAPVPAQPALRGDGIGDARFGAPADDVIAYLTQALGPPRSDTGWQETGYDPTSEDDQCRSPWMRTVHWGGLWTDFAAYDPAAEEIAETRTFVFWSYLYDFEGDDDDALGLATDRGLRLGDDRARVRELYPDATVDTSYFFERGVVDGLISDERGVNLLEAGTRLCEA